MLPTRCSPVVSDSLRLTDQEQGGGGWCGGVEVHAPAVSFVLAVGEQGGGSRCGSPMLADEKHDGGPRYREVTRSTSPVAHHCTVDKVHGRNSQDEESSPRPTSAPASCWSLQTTPLPARRLCFDDLCLDPPLMGAVEGSSPQGGNSAGEHFRAGVPAPTEVVRGSYLAIPQAAQEQVVPFDRVYSRRKEAGSKLGPLPAQIAVSVPQEVQTAAAAAQEAILVAADENMCVQVNIFVDAISTPSSLSVLSKPPASVPITKSRCRPVIPVDFKPWRSPRLALQGSGVRCHSISKAQRVTMKNLGIIEEEEEANDEAMEEYVQLFDELLPPHHVEALAELLHLELAEPEFQALADVAPLAVVSPA